jgi:hypothetical protein
MQLDMARLHHALGRHGEVLAAFLGLAAVHAGPAEVNRVILGLFAGCRLTPKTAAEWQTSLNRRLGPIPDSCIAAIASLLDHLVGLRQHCLGNGPTRVAGKKFVA